MNTELNLDLAGWTPAATGEPQIDAEYLVLRQDGSMANDWWRIDLQGRGRFTLSTPHFPVAYYRAVLPRPEPVTAQQLKQRAYLDRIQLLLQASLVSYYAEVARLLPTEQSDFNEGWLAHTHALPRVSPGPAGTAACNAWEAGWDEAKDTSRSTWATVKAALLR